MSLSPDSFDEHSARLRVVPDLLPEPKEVAVVSGARLRTSDVFKFDPERSLEDVLMAYLDTPLPPTLSLVPMAVTHRSTVADLPPVAQQVEVVEATDVPDEPKFNDWYSPGMPLI